MSVKWRAALALVLATVLSGCTQPWMLEDLPGSSTTPSITPSRPAATPTPSPTAPESPAPDPVRERYPYLGTISDDNCVPAPRDLLDELEALAAPADGVTLSHGALVQANEPWWTIAVATRVDPGNPHLTRKDVDAVLWFVSNGPSLPEDGLSTWPLNPGADDDAADRALTCLSRVPTPPPPPPDGSPESYTGRLAPDSTCITVWSAMLTHLERVGQVGGAITYSRGQMVRANKNWWTVAVATEVHPNKLGLTRANVPQVAYFVTNSPSVGSGAVYFAPDSVEQDSAAAEARRCLTG